MTQFFNRTEELALIEEAIMTLRKRQSLLRSPIIEFCGIEGIGKTTLLRKVEEQCQDKALPTVWADVKKQDAHIFLEETRRRVEGKEPVVFILDALDEAHEQLPQIENGLRDLVENSNLFVVLASRKIERFSNSRAITRKLKLQLLKPFDRESSRTYLENYGVTLNEVLREIIYDWTQGYPLAMNVMADGIVNNKLDPTQESGRHRLLSLVQNRVLQQAIFSKVEENDQLFHQDLLGLLSIPRRFNLVIMQKLIEKYAHQHQQATSIAYINIPERINKGTNVLSWNMSRGGYCVEEPARNMFLLKNRVERPPRYLDINRFLADLNKQFAEQVSGPDRIRYLREFFYHLAISGEATDLSAVLKEYLEQQITREEAFVQFTEEFRQDTELQEILGEHVNVVYDFIQKRREALQTPDSRADRETEPQ